MRTTFLIIALFLISLPIIAQNKLKASAGVGIIDVFNVGVDYQLNQSELGVNLGFWPNELNSQYSSVNYYYHFAGKSKFTTVKPWFVRTGMFIVRSKNIYEIKYHFLTTLRVGREFNFSNRIGVALDAGASCYTFQYTKVLSSKPFVEGIYLIRFLPNGSIKVFYRF